MPIDRHKGLIKRRREAIPAKGGRASRPSRKRFKVAVATDARHRQGASLSNAISCRWRSGHPMWAPTPAARGRRPMVGTSLSHPLLRRVLRQSGPVYVGQLSELIASDRPLPGADRGARQILGCWLGHAGAFRAVKVGNQELFQTVMGTTERNPIGPHHSRPEQVMFSATPVRRKAGIGPRYGRALATSSAHSSP